MTAKILAQSGSDRFLVDVGDPPDETDRATARVYERSTHVLHPAFARESIIARGYWDDPTLDPETRKRVEAEVDELA